MFGMGTVFSANVADERTPLSSSRALLRLKEKTLSPQPPIGP